MIIRHEAIWKPTEEEKMTATQAMQNLRAMMTRTQQYHCGRNWK